MIVHVRILVVSDSRNQSCSMNWLLLRASRKSEIFFGMFTHAGNRKLQKQTDKLL